MSVLRSAVAFCVLLAMCGSSILVSSRTDVHTPSQLEPHSSNSKPACALMPYELRVDGILSHAIAVSDTPRLSWKLKSVDARSTRAHAVQSGSNCYSQSQYAYEVCVVSGNDCSWTSGKIVSNETLNIEYSGPSLTELASTAWRVRVWDRSARAFTPGEAAPGPWSLPHRFTRAPRHPATFWKDAHWISFTNTRPTSACGLYKAQPETNPLFRTVFDLRSPTKVVDAQLLVAGLGWFSAYVDGHEVHKDTWFQPGWTSYARRVLYTMQNVTSLLSADTQTHSLSVELGNGWLNPLPLKFWGHVDLTQHLLTANPQLILKLVLKFADGSTQAVTSDPSTWTTHAGPRLQNNIYLGEVFDAHRVLAGWTEPFYNDSTWNRPVLSDSSDHFGPLQPQRGPPTVTAQRLRGRVLSSRDGVAVVDFGRNFGGSVEFAVHNSPGEHLVVTFLYGEILYKNGSVNGLTSVAGQIKHAGEGGPCAPPVAFQQDVYISDGQPAVFVPRYTWHGFRYVQVRFSGNSSEVDWSLAGLVLHAELEDNSHFWCSNQRFNDIHQMIRNTHLSNMMSLVQSDCPHRERFGYTGDMWATTATSMINFNMQSFHRKRVQDAIDAMTEQGGVTETAPYVGIHDNGLGGDSGPVGWDTMLPWTQMELYRVYGELDLLTKSFEATYKWIQFLDKAPNDLIENGLSEWMPVEAAPRAITGHVFQLINYMSFASLCRVLGKDALVSEYTAKALAVEDLLNKQFLNTTTGIYSHSNTTLPSQCAQALALYYGFAPSGLRERVLSALVSMLPASDPHLAVGMFALKPLFLSLSANCSLNHYVFAMLNTTTYPSYGFMLDAGATTLWESWFYSNNTYSHNHPMFSAADLWLLQRLGGIEQPEDSVAFEKIALRPLFHPGLTEVDAAYESARGPITVRWVYTPTTNTADIAVSVPPNTHATLRVPGCVKELLPGWLDLPAESCTEQISLGSGTYQLSVAVSQSCLAPPPH